MNLQIFLYYIFCCASVFYYCIGLKQAVMTQSPAKTLFLSGSKTAFTILLSAYPVWLFCKLLLVDKGLVELYPFFLVLVVLFVSKLIDYFFGTLFQTDNGGILTSLSILFLAINEATSISEVYLIALSIFVSIYTLVPFIYAIKKRSSFYMDVHDTRVTSITFFTVAFIFLAVYCWHISWLNWGLK